MGDIQIKVLIPGTHPNQGVPPHPGTYKSQHATAWGNITRLQLKIWKVAQGNACNNIAVGELGWGSVAFIFVVVWPRKKRGKGDVVFVKPQNGLSCVGVTNTMSSSGGRHRGDRGASALSIMWYSNEVDVPFLFFLFGGLLFGNILLFVLVHICLWLCCLLLRLR